MKIDKDLIVSGLFFMQKFNQKEGISMFPMELLEIIFADKNLQQFDIYTQSTVIHAIERAIYENGFEIIKYDLDGQIQEQ